MTTDAAATRTWDTISQRLREALNPSTYDTWFGGTEALEASPERLVVGVPNEFTKTWIEGHFGSLLNAAAAEHELVVELRVAVSEAGSGGGRRARAGARAAAGAGRRCPPRSAP